MTDGYSLAHGKAEAVAEVLRAMAALVGGAPQQPGLSMKEEAALLEARARDLSQGLFKIIVLGEFKNGKSTLLNSMLGSKTLPAKAAPSTAIITILEYGEGDEVAIYEADRPEPRRVSWQDFVGEFQLSLQDQETLEQHGTLDRFHQVRYAQVPCRHPLCANGVKLIDSPGLGEHLSRTRVATEFLRQSQAVIFVLNATRILGQEEREFVETVLGPGRLNHVFFVVNRIDQVGAEGRAEIEDWVETALADHFRDESGAFDRDFYQRRVYFVDARSALDARMAQPNDEEKLQSSGLPRLEAELERFLTSDEKIVAALQSTVQTVGPIAERALQRIEQQKAALDQPLADLERHHAEAERQLDGLQRRKHEIERTVLLFGEMITQKVYADLRAYIDEMHAQWPEDSHHLVDLDRAISFKNLLFSYAQTEARERMAAAIAEQVQRYLQIKFGQWLDRVPAAVDADVQQMVAEVEAQVGDFQLELDQIVSAFAGTPLKRSGKGHAGLLDLALSLGDISGMTYDVMHPSDWSASIGRMAQQAVAVLLVSTFITGSLVLAFLVVEAVNLGLHEHDLKKRIRQSLGDRLHESLEERIAERRGFINEALGQRFRQFAQGVTDAIQAQIDAVREEQARILAQKRDADFSVGAEKQRLDSIAVELRELSSILAAEAATPLPAIAEPEPLV